MISTFTSNPFGVISSLPKYCKSFHWSLFLIVKQGCSFNTDSRLENSDPRLEPVLALYSLLSKDIQCGHIDDFTNMLPPFFDIASWTIFKGFFNSIDKFLTVSWNWCRSCINTWASSLLWAVDLLWLEADFAANQGMIGVTVRTMVTASDKDTVQWGPSSDNEVKLVPMLCLQDTYMIYIYIYIPVYAGWVDRMALLENWKRTAWLDFKLGNLCKNLKQKLQFHWDVSVWCHMNMVAPRKMYMINGNVHFSANKMHKLKLHNIMHESNNTQ